MLSLASLHRLKVRSTEKLFQSGPFVVWTSLGPLPQWVPEPTTLWTPGTT
jgi:hypothetical protein